MPLPFTPTRHCLHRRCTWHSPLPPPSPQRPVRAQARLATMSPSRQIASGGGPSRRRRAFYRLTKETAVQVGYVRQIFEGERAAGRTHSLSNPGGRKIGPRKVSVRGGGAVVLRPRQWRHALQSPTPWPRRRDYDRLRLCPQMRRDYEVGAARTV